MFSLRRYFPASEIVGIDINSRNIAVCRRKLGRSPDPRIRFEVAGSAAGEPDEGFDAIFAMAVFRHGRLNTTPPPPVCTPHLRFEQFEAAAADLGRCLRRGGFLVIRHAQFRLRDTAAFDDFEVIRVEADVPATPVYGPDNRLLPPDRYDELVFRKRLTAMKTAAACSVPPPQVA